MAKTEAKSKEKSKEKATQKSKANAKLVAAIRQLDAVAMEHQSCLITIGEIAQNESLSRAEVELSLMEARDIDLASARSQYSRMKGIWSNPKVLQDLKEGKITLKEARMATTKKQANPSKKKQSENLEKRYNKAITDLCTCAKEGGYDLNSVIMAVKASLKKEGIK